MIGRANYSTHLEETSHKIKASKSVTINEIDRSFYRTPCAGYFATLSL